MSDDGMGLLKVIGQRHQGSLAGLNIVERLCISSRVHLSGRSREVCDRDVHCQRCWGGLGCTLSMDPLPALASTRTDEGLRGVEDLQSGIYRGFHWQVIEGRSVPWIFLRLKIPLTIDGDTVIDVTDFAGVTLLSQSHCFERRSWSTAKFGGQGGRSTSAMGYVLSGILNKRSLEWQDYPLQRGWVISQIGAS